RTEAAGAGTDRAHQHDGGGAVGPAFPHVGAMGFLTYRAQPMLGYVALDRFEAITCRRLDPQPLGLGLEHGGFGVGAALLAVLDGGNTLGIAEFFTTGNVVLRAVRHRGQGSW